MTPNTAFGKEVRKALIDRGQTLTWLTEEVSKRTGLYIDRSYLYKIFIGKRNAPKVKTAVCDILELPEEVHDAKS